MVMQNNKIGDLQSQEYVGAAASPNAVVKLLKQQHCRLLTDSRTILSTVKVLKNNHLD